MRRHADAKNRLNARRKAGVKTYLVPLRAADLEAWLRLLGRIFPFGPVEKTEVETALVSVPSEAISYGIKR